MSFGTVTRYATGAPVRSATAAEWRSTADLVNSEAAGGYTGAWRDGDGSAVYVDGGPETAVTDLDLKQLRDAAGTAGDPEQARLCTQALAGDAKARQQCVRAILDTRMELRS